MATVYELSPLWTLVDGNAIGFDLSFTRGLRVHGIDPECLASTSLEDLSTRVQQALCGLPEEAIVRFVALETSPQTEQLSEYSAAMADHTVGRYLARKKRAQLASNTASFSRQLFCFASTPADPFIRSYNAQALGRRAGKMLDKARAIHASKHREARQLQQSAAAVVQAIGGTAEPLDTTELFSVLWALANPVLAQRLTAPLYCRHHSLRSQLFASGGINHIDFHEREGCLHRVMTASIPPRSVVPTQILDLQGLPFAHLVVISLRRLSQSEATKRVERSRTQAHELASLLARYGRGASLPDHGLAEQAADSNDVLRRLTSGEKLFDVVVQLWLPAPNHDVLRERTDLAMAAFRRFGQAEGAVEELRSLSAFLSMLPGHHALIGDRWHAFLASRAADLLPLYEARAGNGKPTALLRTRGGKLVKFSPFDPTLPAWNATVAGGTGSGKSFAARTLLSGWLASGGRSVIVTRGADYERFAHSFSGSVMNVEPESPTLCLSPFSPQEAVNASPNRELVIEHISSILGVLCCEGSRGLSRQNKRLLYNVTDKLYRDSRKTPDFDQWLRALERHVASDPAGLSVAEPLVTSLCFWLEGPFAQALSRRGASTNAAALTVWNLERISDEDTQSVVLSLLSGRIRDSIGAAPTVVVLDEVWSVLRSDTGAELAEVLYRTIRKLGSSI